MSKQKQHVYIVIRYSIEGEDPRILGVYSSKTMAQRVIDKAEYYAGFERLIHYLLKFPVQGMEVILQLDYRQTRMIKIHS